MNCFTLASRFESELKRNISRRISAITDENGVFNKKLAEIMCGSPVSLEEATQIISQKEEETLLKQFDRVAIRAWELQNRLKKLKPESFAKKYTKFKFITINPDTSKCSFNTFKYEIEYTLLNFLFKGATKVSYVFEQRGKTKDNMGDGFHLHMLIDYENGVWDKTNFIRDVYRKVSKCVGSKEAIDVKYVDDIDGVLKYMKGNKKDGFKEDACKINTLWRKQENLEKIYHKTSPPTSPSAEKILKQSGIRLIKF